MALCHISMEIARISFLNFGFLVVSRARYHARFAIKVSPRDKSTRRQVVGGRELGTTDIAESISGLRSRRSARKRRSESHLGRTQPSTHISRERPTTNPVSSTTRTRPNTTEQRSINNDRPVENQSSRGNTCDLHGRAARNLGARSRG